MRILVASIILLLVSSCYPYPVMAQSPVKQITITKTYFCSNHEYVVNDLEKKDFVVLCSVLSIFKKHQKENRKIFTNYLHIYT